MDYKSVLKSARENLNGSCKVCKVCNGIACSGEVPGMGVIIGRYKKIANAHGNVSVINMNPRVEKVFNLSGMGKIINVCKSYEDAINS